MRPGPVGELLFLPIAWRSTEVARSSKTRPDRLRPCDPLDADADRRRILHSSETLLQRGERQVLRTTCSASRARAVSHLQGGSTLWRPTDDCLEAPTRCALEMYGERLIMFTHEYEQLARGTFSAGLDPSSTAPGHVSQVMITFS